MNEPPKLDADLERKIDSALAEPSPAQIDRCVRCGSGPDSSGRLTFGLCTACFVDECNSDSNDYYDIDDYLPFFDEEYDDA